MAEPRAAEYNVVATYHGPQQARKALQELKTSGVPESNLSFLSRDDETAVSEKETHEETAEVPAGLGKKAAAGEQPAEPPAEPPGAYSVSSRVPRPSAFLESDQR